MASQEVREDTAELASRALSDAGEQPPDEPLSGQPSVIPEISEPVTPREDDASYSSLPWRKSFRASVLTEMIRDAPDQEEAIQDGDSSEADDPLGPVTVSNAIISQPHEGTPLLHGRAPKSHEPATYGRLWDLESLLSKPRRKLSMFSCNISKAASRTSKLVHAATSPAVLNRPNIWRNMVLKPASYLPAVVLGLLLNILDALSYGRYEPPPCSSFTGL